MSYPIIAELGTFFLPILKKLAAKIPFWNSIFFVFQNFENQSNSETVNSESCGLFF
jgi:hypothetical protein